MRRDRDSNPGYAFGVYTLSRRAPSTTRTSLLLSGRKDTSICSFHKRIFFRFESVFLRMEWLVMHKIRIRQVLTLGILALVMLCIAPVPTIWGGWLSQRVLPTALVLLTLGICCGFLNQTRLMLVFLGGSFAIVFNQHVILGDLNGAAAEESLTVGFIHHGAQVHPASFAQAHGLPHILLVEASEAVSALSVHYPFCVFLPPDRQGTSRCLLSRLPISRQDNILLQDHMPALAVRIHLENNQRLFTWVICPVNSEHTPTHSKFPVKQPFVLYSNGLSELPRTLQQLERCLPPPAPLLISLHFRCQQTAPITVGADTIGLSCALRRSNSYAYAD